MIKLPKDGAEAELVDNLGWRSSQQLGPGQRANPDAVKETRARRSDSRVSMSAKAGSREAMAMTGCRRVDLFPIENLGSTSAQGDQ